MKQFTFSITDEAFDLLKHIQKEGYVEYRDTEYYKVEDFQKSDLFKDGKKTLSYFLNRNSNGTYYLIGELDRYGLLEMDDMAWHSTYVLSHFAKELLNEMKN
jgi:hypothetical protein